LAQIESHEKHSLDTIVNKMTEIAEIIHLDRDVISAAIQNLNNLALQPQDSFVYRSILAHLRTRDSQEEKLFISRNSKDFDEKVIIDELNALGCRYMFSFLDACGFLDANLTRS